MYSASCCFRSQTASTSGSSWASPTACSLDHSRTTSSSPSSVRTTGARRSVTWPRRRRVASSSAKNCTSSSDLPGRGRYAESASSVGTRSEKHKPGDVSVTTDRQPQQLGAPPGRVISAVATTAPSDADGSIPEERSAAWHANEETAASTGLGDDVAVHAASEPAGERQSKTGTLVAALPCGTATHARLEDPIVLVVRDAWPVVLDRIEDTAVVASDRNANPARAVAARVLDDRLQDALREIRVDADAHRPRRLRHLERQAPFGGEPAACACSIRRDRMCIRGATFTPRLVARRGYECIDRARELRRVSLDERERLAVIVRLAVAAQREL